MNTFWQNVYQFPKFLISIIIGFFLTTLYPISQSLKGRYKKIILLIIIIIFIEIIYITLRLMLELG